MFVSGNKQMHTQQLEHQILDMRSQRWQIYLIQDCCLVKFARLRWSNDQACLLASCYFCIVNVLCSQRTPYLLMRHVYSLWFKEFNIIVCKGCVHLNVLWFRCGYLSTVVIFYNSVRTVLQTIFTFCRFRNYNPQRHSRQVCMGRRLWWRCSDGGRWCWSLSNL